MNTCFKEYRLYDPRHRIKKILSAASEGVKELMTSILNLNFASEEAWQEKLDEDETKPGVLPDGHHTTDWWHNTIYAAFIKQIDIKTDLHATDETRIIRQKLRNLIPTGMSHSELFTFYEANLIELNHCSAYLRPD